MKHCQRQSYYPDVVHGGAFDWWEDTDTSRGGTWKLYSYHCLGTKVGLFLLTCVVETLMPAESNYVIHFLCHLLRLKIAFLTACPIKIPLY